MTRLSANIVKNASKPGYYGDGRGGFGLALLVRKSADGRLLKSWTQRLRIDGQPFMLGLGAYPLVMLGRARDKALENARTVEAGGDPRRQQTPATLTFADCLERAIEIQRPGWRNAKTEKNMRSRYGRTRARLPLAVKPVDTITPADVLDVPDSSGDGKTGHRQEGEGRLFRSVQVCHCPGASERQPC